MNVKTKKKATQKSNTLPGKSPYLETESIMHKLGKLTELMSETMTAEELSKYFRGKSFDEINSEFSSSVEQTPKARAEALQWTGCESGCRSLDLKNSFLQTAGATQYAFEA